MTPVRPTDARVELESLYSLILRHPDGVGVAELDNELKGSISRRTLSRRLNTLLRAGKIRRRGERKGTLYFPQAAAPRSILQPLEEAAQFETADGSVAIPITAAAHEILQYVSSPTAARLPVGYARSLLDEYVANRTNYLPDELKTHLHKIGAHPG